MYTGGEDRLWNRPFSQLLDLRDLDLGSGHTTYHHVSLIDLYLQINFTKNRKTFCGRIYIQMDTHRREET